MAQNGGMIKQQRTVMGWNSSLFNLKEYTENLLHQLTMRKERKKERKIKTLKISSPVSNPRFERGTSVNEKQKCCVLDCDGL
jgi:hypothetical protein